jgi:hypothetical protein
MTNPPPDSHPYHPSRVCPDVPRFEYEPGTIHVHRTSDHTMGFEFSPKHLRWEKLPHPQAFMVWTPSPFPTGQPDNPHYSPEDSFAYFWILRNVHNLVAFAREVDEELILSPSGFHELMPELEIYDTYRE